MPAAPAPQSPARVEQPATGGRPARTALSRRTFLQALGAGAAFTALGPASAALADEAVATVGAAQWPQVKAQFMIDPEIVYMNIGTVGSPPRAIVRELDRVHREVASVPLSGYGSFVAQRQAIAPDFGCDHRELAIAGNTTDALTKITSGIAWHEGDEIVTTNHEHSAGLSALAMVRDRWGVVIRTVELPTGDGQDAETYVDRFRQAITPSTRALLFSSPTFLTGTILPIRMLVDLAIQHELISIVDGAHLPGMLELDLHALGMDFFAGPGAKWQCAPSGSGILYARNQVSEHNPLPLPEFWPTISMQHHNVSAYFPDARHEIDLGGVLTDIGNQSRAIFDALVATCALWNEIGRDRIEQRVLELGARLKQGTVERWGIGALYSPLTDARLHSGLTTLNPFLDPADIMDQSKASQFVARLQADYGYVIRFTTTPVPGYDVPHRPMRVSTHLFHDEADVDGVLDAMHAVATSMA